MEVKEHILFVGNPGTGKSTLLNSLIGELKFKSGVSFGGGMTYEFQKHEHNGIVYCDTPGLEDIKLREAAAKSINTALKQNGKYRIFFVVTLESGRIKPADLSTIEIVMKAITIQEKVHFGVIVNKLTPVILTKLKTNNWENDDMKALIASFGTATVVTQYIYYQERVDQIDDQDNVFTTLSKEFIAFINNLPPTVIRPQDVKEINTAAFDQQRMMFENLISEMRKDREAMEKRYTELIKELINRPIPTPPAPIIHVPSPAPPPPFIGGGCFHPTTLITLEDGSLIPISKISIGDKVLGLDMKPKEVYYVNVHEGSFNLVTISLQTQSGNMIELKLTDDHILPIAKMDDVSPLSANKTNAGNVKPGSLIWVVSVSENVEKQYHKCAVRDCTSSIFQGKLFNPLVFDNHIITNGIISTCYTINYNFQHADTWFLRTVYKTSPSISSNPIFQKIVSSWDDLFDPVWVWLFKK